MDSIDRESFQTAADIVAKAFDPDRVVIHTATITVNGQHGGVDVLVEGMVIPHDGEPFDGGEDFTKRYEVRNPGQGVAGAVLVSS